MFYQATSYLAKAYNYTIALTRQSSGSVISGFLAAIGETIFAFIMIMAIMLFIRGMGGIQIRGEFGLFILSGVACFLTHNKVLTAVATVTGSKTMMPLLGIDQGILIIGKTLHNVYLQIIATIFFLIACYIWYRGYSFEYPAMVLGIYALVIFWSIALGMLFLAITPLWPKPIGYIMKMYMRIGIITSGKMVPGNMLVGRYKGMFEYNPLFHLIDQMRGAVFVNYTPYNSNLAFPIKTTIFIAAIAIIINLSTKRLR